MNFKTLKELFNCAIKAYSKNMFLCMKGGTEYSYAQFGEKVKEISALLLHNRIMPKEKIGILSQNMPNWGVSFMSCAAYNRIAVPMLPDFSEMEITNIIEHSECKALFVSKRLFPKISESVKEKLSCIIEIDDFTVIKGEALHPDTEKQEEFSIKIASLNNELQNNIYTPAEEDLATIIYTSGTTGNSKGVMLTHRNLSTHLYSARELRPSFEWDVWLSILPLSHTLECSLSFLLPFSSGSQVHYLAKAPTPTILLNALKEIRPTTLLVVPLIIEKIYRNAILPKIKANPIMAKMYKSAIGRKMINALVGKEMKKMFGGRMRFFGIGGAKLDGEVEKFLLEAKFPYAIGYGLTECSPLLAGAPPHMVKWQTTGPAVPGVQLKINNPDPVTGEGELVAKGPNIMVGYYKNPQATADTFTEDGWFRTKDLGYIDSKGWVSIRGRLNSMIVGASGENIYPEEIETIINTHANVAESLVTSRKGILVAKICLSQEKLDAFNQMKVDVMNAYHKNKVALIESYEAKKEEWKKEYANKKEQWQSEYDQMRRELYKNYVIKREEAALAYQAKKKEVRNAIENKKAEMEKEIQEYVNSKVNKFSKISIIELQEQAFEKTATHKIKRYLYTN